MDANWVSLKLILAAALLQSSCAVELNVTTPEVEVGKAANVTLKCFNLFPKTEISAIVTLRLLKRDHEKWNKTVEIRRGGKVEIKQKSLNAFAEGSIETVADSFLQLTWPVSTNDTIGQYRSLSETVEENRQVCLQQLRSLREDVLNTTTTLEASFQKLEASFQNTLKSLVKVLNFNTEKKKKEDLKQTQDILHNVTVNMATLQDGFQHRLSNVKEQLQRHSCADVRYLSRPSYVRLYNDMDVVCDKGWIVIQRRPVGGLDFRRKWEDYRNGFGYPPDNFWFGLEKVHRLTRLGRYQLRIDMTYKNKDYFAMYDSFSLSEGENNYKLHVSGFSGNVGDHLAYNNGQEFTTPDRDNDQHRHNCATLHSGGWWYNRCTWANLNGEWASTEAAKNLEWYSLTGSRGSVSFSMMKIRPLC
ncbi:fibrinogen-like protein 1 isoform X2 [Aplysia californica]|uniref:Fibrinogen-like protein 1 isoform X2 n=1 Tax=Aplysia californica TaxID=6500 RepID=A0ABM1VVC1_APLCA|nr:fibrinogen-like protein 1 isoform X2 [Aplysia californica]